MEDPPAHTVHRKLLSRMFTPRRVAELETKTRQFCVELLDPLVGAAGFDFVQDLGQAGAEPRDQHAHRASPTRTGTASVTGSASYGVDSRAASS